MTAGEKFQMVQKFAALAFDIYGAVSNPLGAYTAIRDAQRLSQYMTAMRAHTAVRSTLRIDSSIYIKLRPLPVETLRDLFAEPGQGDTLLKQ